MAILSVFGVSFPVAVDGLSMGGELVGKRSRNAAGYALLERKREKIVLDFSLVSKPLDEAMLYRALLLGEGEFYNTLTNYGSKGYQLSGTGTRTSAGGGNPNNGNGVFRCNAGQTMTIIGWLYDAAAITTASSSLFGSTAIMWRRDDATGAYRVCGFSWRTYDTTATVKREALGTSSGLGTLGTPQAFTGAETFAVASRNLTITAPVGGPYSYSNIMLIPRYMPAAQVDQLIVGRNLAQYTFPALPRVYVQSDLFPVDLQKPSPVGIYDSSLIMLGEVDAMPVVPAWEAGLYTQTRMALSGRLVEV